MINMNYEHIIQDLYGRLPMYQRVGTAAYKADLNNTLYLDNFLNNPHRKFSSIHVAGTNGKGSVSHMIASILQEAGYKTGLYTSPHLKDFRERIRVNGKMIEKQYVVEFVDWISPVIEEVSPSFFEITVALAFQYFADEKVDFAVVEVGMGGRLDSTNIITPVLSVITNISLDHVKFLGESVELIAAEKAGIIKDGLPVVIGKKQSETTDVYKKIAKKKDAVLIYAEDHYQVTESKIYNYQNQQVFSSLKPDLKGLYQKENIGTVLTAIEKLIQQGYSISNKNIVDGLSRVVENTGILGRWQVLHEKPLVICDTGHNEAGINMIVSQLKNYNYKTLHFVFGTVNDKNISKILSLLPLEAVYYFTKADIPRAMDAAALKHEAEKFGLSGRFFSSVKQAYQEAIANTGEDDLVFIGGSTFVVAEVLD